MQRLKQRAEFQAVLAAATLARTPHFALHGLMPSVGENPAPALAQALTRPAARMGAMVPKRWAKRAVTRNTIKRQIYAVSTQFRNTLLPSDYVVRLRSAFDAQRFASATSPQLRAAVRAELTQLFARATQGSAA